MVAQVLYEYASKQKKGHEVELKPHSVPLAIFVLAK